jgi:hypothetical protein
MDSNWYLRKHDDGSIHGPVPLEQLRDWSLSAKISPLDKVSSDRQATWLRAPMVEDLHMDWLVEVSDDYLYGPTTFGAVQEFLAADEIGGETYLINTRDGGRSQIKNMPAFRQPAAAVATPGQVTSRLDDGSSPKASQGGARISQIESMLIQQRRALEEAEQRYQNLRAKYIEKTGEQP